jgi:predicted kinase
MNKPKLFIMIGLSAAGKSTIAKELAKDYEAVIVSSDSIRKEICGNVSDQSKNEEVFKLFHKRIRKYLHEKRNVIADATNITMKSRRAIINNVKKMDIEIIAYIVPKKIEDCIKDNVEREYIVQEEVIYKQMKRFQIPFLEEGFDKIIVHDFNYDLRYKLYPLEIIEKMTGFDQKNPHHNMYLEDHCDFTYNKFSDLDHPYDIYKSGFLLGAKIHDFGKLCTQTIDENGIAHYFGHENVGSYCVLTTLYNPFEEYNTDVFLLDCCFLINYHMMPFNWNTEKTKNKWKNIFGEEKYNMLLRFHECDKARCE